MVNPKHDEEYKSFQLYDGETCIGSVVAQNIDQVECVLNANNVQTCSIYEVGADDQHSFQLNKIGEHTA